jgi:hypothetical protein
LTAFFGATLALVGAALTVIHFVFAAFGSARVANVRTKTTELLRKLRASAHEGSGGPATLRTILIESDALGHHGDVFLPQALVTAVFAFLRAANASVDTALKLFVAHNWSPFRGVK